MLADALAFLLAFGLLAALLVCVLLRIRPLRSGKQPMDDNSFTYRKFLTALHEFGLSALLPFTSVFARPLVAVLFGAKVGTNTSFGGAVEDPYLVYIEDGAILGPNSLPTAHTITSGRIMLQEVRIGRGATVGDPS